MDILQYPRDVSSLYALVLDLYFLSLYPLYLLALYFLKLCCICAHIYTGWVLLLTCLRDERESVSREMTDPLRKGLMVSPQIRQIDKIDRCVVVVV
jgi:hypothetical protein